ncbi:hypothetical protein CRUP_032302, partial [Coryphaenoides rupestris]
MSFTVEEVIIILSDDEDSACDDTHNDSSVLFVEEKEKVVPDRPLPAQALEEDLVVTFSRRAEVLPHARYDCPVYPFTRADFEKTAPIDDNHLICEQCFCYVCDKLASLCSLWRVKDMCHCNSHQRSELWSGLRSSAVLGHLLAFNFSLSDLDGHLRLAEMLLQTFRKELGLEFSRFLQGKMDGLQGLVYEIQLLTCPKASAIEAKGILLQRVVASVRRVMVMSDLPSAFIDKLHGFFQRLNLSGSFRHMKQSLSVRPWDDVLLVSILKGQNVTGLTYDVLISFQELRDLAPLFLCMTGDFSGALSGFFGTAVGPATRLSPALFRLYLRVFDTATAPGVLGKLDQLCAFQGCSTWRGRRRWVRRHSANAGMFRLAGEKVFPDHALLLLVTEALVQRIVSGPLSPSLPVINSFKENPWALRWFCQNLSLTPDVSFDFMTAVQQELVNTGDNIPYLPLQPSSPPPSSSSPEPWD